MRILLLLISFNLFSQDTECPGYVFDKQLEGYKFTGQCAEENLPVCDMAIDNLGKMNSDSLISKYYNELDSLMIKINDGKEFKVFSRPAKNYHINFFYSSSRP